MMRPGRNVIARELQSMLDCGYQVAKAIVLLAEKPADTFQLIGKKWDERKGPGQRRRPMAQSEAARYVDAAVTRIKLIDEDELCTTNPTTEGK